MERLGRASTELDMAGSSVEADIIFLGFGKKRGYVRQKNESYIVFESYLHSRVARGTVRKFVEISLAVHRTFATFCLKISL
jgi:hypothetical protein